MSTSPPPAPADAPDPAHFARAVTELGEQRSVVASSAIYNTQGLKIIDKGVAIDARLYQRLTQHQLKLPLADSVESEPGVSTLAVQDAARLMCSHQPFFAAMTEDPRVRDMLFDELALIPLPKAVSFHLTLARETRSDLWQHMLRSAVTAAWLGACQGGTRYDARMCAAAGLLHDLGVLHLDPVLQQPEVQLGRDQRRQLYSHPLVTVMLLERYHEYPKELLRAVLEHHETLDGSGYPRNVSGAALSPWGRVLSLTEVVTAMFGSGHRAPALQLSLVLRMNRHRYDAELVREVVQLLPAAREDWKPPSDEDPRRTLGEIDRLLNAWPAEPPPPAAGAASQRDRVAAFAAVHDQCGQVLRILSATGASKAQLVQLGAGDLDAELIAELSLVIHEALWQLRTVGRQARRRWRLRAGESFPPWMQRWLDEIDALCASHLKAL